MARMLCALWLTLLMSGMAQRASAADAAPAPVTPGVGLTFPRDYGAHPDFGVEWWYVTGWLTTGRHEQLGFQVTFFRTRVALAHPDVTNPSAFAATQLLIAHCAISDPARGHLWQDQRIRRAGMQLAQAQSADTNVWIDDWSLKREADTYQTHITAEDFSLNLSLQVQQSVMLNGASGYSQKGPAAQSASYYYSQPQLQVSGSILRAARADTVTGIAWLDHEWSSHYLDAAADGWDWVGLNMNDGGALMAFRIRDTQGGTYWAAGTLRDAQGHTRSLGSDQIGFSARRYWRSTRTGVSYPVSWQIRAGERELTLEPLMDDQENDTRLSTGSIYWEGAVRATERGRNIGRGYLEMTGYERPLTLR
jgi:predicted secreted hydrolase